MSFRDTLQGSLAVLFVLLVVVAIAWLPTLSREDSGPGSRTSDRLDKLEAEQQRLGRVVSDLGSDVALVATRSEESAARMASVMPSDAVWIELRTGGNAQWDLGEDGRARVEFLQMGETSSPLPRFRVTHRAGQINVELAAGQSMRAVHDQGAKQVAYLATLHRLRLDRKGYPQAALLSVTIEN